MHVAVVDFACVDPAAHVFVGLVSEPSAYYSRAGQRTVKLISHRRACEERQVSRMAAFSEGFRNGFRIADDGEAAHSYGHAGLYQLRRFAG